MKRALFIALACGLASLVAQETPAPKKVDPATAFAIAPPDENSPFFSDPNAAGRTRGTDFAGRDLNDRIADYPQNRDSTDSVGTQVRNFFRDMFASVKVGRLRPAPMVENLEIQPEQFSLNDRHEIDAKYTIRNNTKNMIRLEYPTTQRIDIVTTDTQGKVIDRWSDDRSFRPEDGIVVINPKERIEYQAKIPTRDMKAGQPFWISATTTSQDKFEAGRSVTPQ